MSARRLVRAIQAIPRTLSRTTAALVKRFMTSLLRALFLWGHNPRQAWQGFVLPTTVLMLLMVSLTAGALTYRAYTRSTNTIIARQQQVISNATSPAIERAKAKLEYLFGPDRNRWPLRVPTSNQFVALLSGEEDDSVNVRAPEVEDIYDIPGETRVDINGDGELDNAWVFPADVNGDGDIDDEFVAYTIIIDDENGGALLTSRVDDAKARALVVRNGPITAEGDAGGCTAEELGGAQQDQSGWLSVGANRAAKNFQITAFAVDNNSLGGTTDTLELQQVRETPTSNKWGAWFRYDLEAYPGPIFNWNGAMHTEGSLMLRDRIRLHMVSSGGSCLYDADSSEITVGQRRPNGFRGQLIKGTVESTGGENVRTYRYNGQPANPNNPGTPPNTNLSAANQSVVAAGGANLTAPALVAEILQDPVELYVSGRSVHSVPPGSGWAEKADNLVADARGFEYFDGFQGRIRPAQNDEVQNLGLDDVFRADDRWGPSPVYDEDAEGGRIPTGTNIGTPIAGNTLLTDEQEGLDGYWERQAIATGLRIIVGERLELGNADGWNNDPTRRILDPRPDPLYPPDALSPRTANNNGAFSLVEQKQRRTLRDNLAAVQGTVVYHFTENEGLSPAACIATTVHPGTLKTIADSRTFRQLDIATAPYNGAAYRMTNFLTGEGTNGWEFTPPTRDDANMVIALQNLANFAGDPKGGAPSFTPVQDGNVHPFPYLSIWGDFSPLRRVLDANSDNLADNSTRDSAACTLGLLAYNLDMIKREYDEFLDDNSTTEANWSELDDKLEQRAGELVDWWLDDGPDGLYGLIKAVRDSTAGTSGTQRTHINNQLARLGLSEFFVADGNQPRIDVRYRNAEGQLVVIQQGSPVPPSVEQLTFEDPERIQDLLNTARRFLAGEVMNGRAADGTLTPQFGQAQVFQDELNSIVGLDEVNGLPAVSGNVDEVQILSRVRLHARVERDREFGFESGPVCPDRMPDADDVPFLSNIYCASQPFYPALHYIFPSDGHSFNAGPIDEEYVEKVRDYVDDNVDINESSFTALDPEDIAAQPRNFDNFVLPTSSAGSLEGAFSTTWISTAGSPDPDNPLSAFSIVRTESDGGNPVRGNVSLLDKAFYNGRELMSVRMLDLDINKLTQPDQINGFAWIPSREEEDDDEEDPAEETIVNGIVYAFREDSVREDEIVRPSSASGDMIITPNALESQDPPLGANAISLKPVDFFPDPDRRPYGFRLRNGSTFNRAADEPVGLSFISNDAIAILGDFNLHTTNNLEEFSGAANTMFGFDPASNDWANRFYQRPRSALNLGNFSNLQNDTWRPAEVLGDAVYMLSGRFRDGFVEAAYARNAAGTAGTAGDGFVTSGDGTGLVSYQNGTRPTTGTGSDDKYAASDFLRQATNNGMNDVTSPIYFDRNGVVYRPDGSENRIKRFQDDAGTNPPNTGAYRGFNFNNYAQRRRQQLAPAEDTTINVLMISGIVPSRFNQSYGGLHNFPRMLEFWTGEDLNIAGGFFQLFFSRTAVAPFVANASSWQGPDLVGNPNVFEYYQPPNRLWGYDVALQYAAQPPIASRFLSVGAPRSEFYRELPVDDPYVSLLRCINPPGALAQLDANANCP
jgi:hypothetical protein